MMKIILEDYKLRVQASEEEARILEADAEKLGVSVQDMLQSKMDEIAAKHLARDKAKA